MSGKGSRPRPYSVDQKTFDSNWDRIFNKPAVEEVSLDEEVIQEQESLQTEADK